MLTVKWSLKTALRRGFLEKAKLSSAIREFVRMLMRYLKAYFNGGSWGIPSLKDILKLAPFGHSKCKRMKDVSLTVDEQEENFHPLKTLHAENRKSEIFYLRLGMK